MPDITDTLQERGNRYGEFIHNGEVSQDLKEIMRNTCGWSKLQPDQKEGLDMIQHKIARILNGDPTYHDNWHDIVGYAKLVADRLIPEGQ